MDEQRYPNVTPLAELIEFVLGGTASDEQKRELDSRLLASAEGRRAYLHRLNLHSALSRQFAYDSEGDAPAQFGLSSVAQNLAKTPRRSRRPGWWSWAAVAAAAVVLVGSIAFMRGGTEEEIAVITEVNGALQWTGSGGRIVRDLEAGSSLRGGTLESLSADSWAVLTFRDGSTVTVSGQSTLTISEGQQKQLRLREGNISASVAPQPLGRPMLIHTPTAKLEVLGTQLNVDAEADSTMLRVNEGRVRATRLTDGSAAEVPADHQVVVSASGRAELKVSRRLQSIHSWQSRLPSGAIYGKWVREEGGMLRAAPVVLNPEKDPITLYLASISAWRGEAPPAVPMSGGRFRIRGRIEASSELYFGLTMKHTKGGFAGKYVTLRSITLSEKTGRRFEIELPIGGFQPQEKEFPASPLGLELVDLWCFTYNQNAELSIASVELLPSTPSTVPTQPTTQPLPVLLMDIWTAAAQGNVQAVKRHLAAGAEINGAFVARGIPASGATPLHLAVLSNQREMARFLVSRGADINARAKDQHGGTPLHWAAALGRIDMTRQLVESGADVNAPDNNGYTPLDAINYDPKARREAKDKIAELLRSKGAKAKPQPREEPSTR